MPHLLFHPMHPSELHAFLCDNRGVHRTRHNALIMGVLSHICCAVMISFDQQRRRRSLGLPQQVGAQWGRTSWRIVAALIESGLASPFARCSDVVRNCFRIAGRNRRNSPCSRGVIATVLTIPNEGGNLRLAPSLSTFCTCASHPPHGPHL